MSQPLAVVLLPLTLADVAAITPWFEDSDTRRYLGGPDWPATMLELGERTVGEAIEAVTGSIAFVTDPRARGRGIGRATITAMLARPELDHVELFEAGVEPDNLASRRCLEAAGFRVRAPEPDYEGMLYYRAGRARACHATATGSPSCSSCSARCRCS